MLRLPAVAGKFYPENPRELSQLVKKLLHGNPSKPKETYQACLVPHAGYLYSGHVAAAVYERIAFPKRVIVLGVRHFPRGAEASIVSKGVWRTPLGDATIDTELAGKISRFCPVLCEDSVAHEREHSLEVQIPFLQELNPGFTFVPIALGTIRFEELRAIGEGLGKVLSAEPELLLLTTSDLNHYEDDRTTRRKDHAAIDKILQFDGNGLFKVCRDQDISMCGLGPTVAMLTALRHLKSKEAEVVKYATSADISGDANSVVGYGGFVFR
jgi:AmmeMemoRadiSam system protein B